MSLRRSLIAALLLALLAPAAASADRLTVRGTQVFKSVVPDLQTQFGNELVTFNGFVYFEANDDVHGNELWRTDGTNAGTSLVSDIYPGLPNTNSNPHRLTVVGDRLYFNAYNETTQSPETVYYIDAVAPTTVKLAKAIPVGGGSPITAIGSLFGAPNGRAVMGRLAEGNGYYAVYAAPPGSDTFAKISAGAESIGIVNVFSPAATAGGWTYYNRGNVNVSPGQGGELWRTNGSVTESVADIYPGNTGSSPSAFVATGNKVYFTADDGSHGRELWVTDPANKADTHIVHEHVPGTAATSINDPGQVANGNILYYVPANDPVTGAEVWRTDGTEAGTRVVKDITPGLGGFSQPILFAFRAGVGILRGGEVFASSDGTDAGTSLLNTVDGDGYGANTPVVLGDRAFFVGGFTPFGQALWRTDGSPAGTIALSAGGFDGTGATSGSPAAQSLAVLGSKLIFFGRDPSTNNTGAVKLFVIDTTQPDEVRQATTPPSISGSPEVGKVLTGEKGAWTLENRFTYQWLRNGTPVPNANGTTYYVSTADVGAQLTFRVTAVGIGPPNQASADSAPVAGVGTQAAPRTAPGGTTPPPKRPALLVKTKGKLTGTARVGKTLKIKLPTFDRSGVKLSFRWSAGGKTVKKRTRSSLKLTKGQRGKKVSVTITATKAGFTTAKVTLGPTAKVKPAKR
jgi:ELWxxDGT repeat protein